MIYRKLIYIMLMAVPLCSLAQGPAETRSFIKEFPAKKDGVLEVNNKYGRVEITTWKKDSVLIRADIRASGTDNTKAKNVFDEISIQITSAGSIILAQTVFDQSINAFFENFKGMTNKVINYDSKVEINYYIKVPEYINLRIDNRYGDVFLEKTEGNLYLNISNGDLKADVPGRRSYMNLSFCDASISEFIDGEIKSSFSEVTITEVKKASLKTISSKYRIKQALELELESRRDDLFIEALGSLRGDSYFTDIEIGSLTDKADMVCRYGNIDFNNIEKGFESLNINSGFSDISIEFDPSLSYASEIRTQNTFIAIPAEAREEERTLNSDRKEYMYTGTVGEDPGSRILKIDANRGKIYIK